MKQPDLFARPEDIARMIVPVPHNGVATSRAAADSVVKSAARTRAAVYAAVRQACERGMTCDEVEVAMSLRHQSASARLNELAGRSASGMPALLVAGPDKRPTRSGRGAFVYRVAP